VANSTREMAVGLTATALDLAAEVARLRSALEGLYRLTVLELDDWEFKVYNREHYPEVVSAVRAARAAIPSLPWPEGFGPER
jgi:hypothetical protein